MTYISINLTFKTLEECKKFEDEHLKDYAKGKTIFMVNHTSSIDSSEVTLDGIYVC